MSNSTDAEKEAKIKDLLQKGRDHQYSIPKRLEEALAYYQAAVELDPKHADAYFSVGDIHKSLGDNEKALENFKKSNDIKFDAYIVKQIADLSRSMGKNEEALKYYDEAIKADNEDWLTHGKKVLVLKALKKEAELKTALQKALELFNQGTYDGSKFVKKDGDAQYLDDAGKEVAEYLKENAAGSGSAKPIDAEKEAKIKDLLQKGRDHQYSIPKRLEEALAYYQAAVELDPKQADAYFSIGDIHKSLGDNEKALENFKKSNDLKPDAYIANMIADLSRSMGKNEEALKYYDEAIKADSEDWLIHGKKVLVLKALKKEAELKTALQKALELFNQGTYDGSKFVKKDGDAQYLDDAGKEVAEYLKENAAGSGSAKPNDAEKEAKIKDLLQKGRDHQYSIPKRLEEALAYYQAAAELDPKQADAYFSIGDIHKSLGDNEKALENFKKSNDLKFDAYIVKQIADLSRSMGKNEEALKYYDEAIKADGNDWVTHGRKAQILKDLKKESQAKDSIQKALELFKKGTYDGTKFVKSDGEEQYLDDSTKEVANYLRDYAAKKVPEAQCCNMF